MCGLALPRYADKVRKHAWRASISPTAGLQKIRYRAEAFLHLTAESG